MASGPLLYSAAEGVRMSDGQEGSQPAEQVPGPLWTDLNEMRRLSQELESAIQECTARLATTRASIARSRAALARRCTLDEGAPFTLLEGRSP